jgi:hypothetical protein
MGFGIARGPLLSLLGEALGVGEDRKTAFLGRFQHLQRLSLIQGINPGRGKAAEYQAHHVAVIAIAFQISQLGLSPERTVSVMRKQKEIVFKGIEIAVEKKDKITECIFSFDPAVLSLHGSDLSDESKDRINWTFWATKKNRFLDLFAHMLQDDGLIERLSIISLGAVLRMICGAMDGFDGSNKPIIGARSREFLSSLREWVQTHSADDLI